MAEEKVDVRVYILPEQPVAELWEKYEYTRSVLRNLGIDSLDACGNLTAAQVVGQNTHAACQLNTTAGYSGAPPIEAEEWMLPARPPVEGYYGDTPRPANLDVDGVALVREDGLPQAFFSATHGRLGVRYSQASGGIDLFTCWPWARYPRARETFFGNGFLCFGHGEQGNVFEKVKLWPFGFENRYGADHDNFSRLVIERNKLVLEVAGTGEVWAEVNLASVITDEGASSHEHGRRWMRLGWDTENHAYVLYVAEMRNPFAGNLFCPPQMTPERCREHKGFNPDESWRDEMTAGNLYFLFSCGEQCPAQVENRLCWRGTEHLEFSLAVGTTYAEAVENLKATRGHSRSIFVRRREHARDVAAGLPRVKAPGHENLEVMAAWLPLQLEAFKWEDYVMKSMADWTYTGAIEIQHSQPGMMYMGDEDFADRFLAFAGKPEHRGRQGQLSYGWNYDWTADISYAVPCSAEYNFLTISAMLQWRVRDDFFHQKRYVPGKAWLEKMLTEADADTGLQVHFWGGDTTLEDFGLRNGYVYTSCTNGCWYSVLRTWEIVAMQFGDEAFATRLRSVAEKVRTNYLRLFYDPKHRCVAHFVWPDTMERGPIFRSNFLGYNVYTPFVEELVAGKETELAESTFRMFFDTDWKGMREFAREGSLSPSVWQYIGTALDDMGPARLFRVARDQNALAACRDMCEHTFGKFHTFGETYSLRPPDATGCNAFNYGLACRYQMMIENFFGITTGPGGIGLFPVGLGSEMVLEGLRYGKSVWDFHLQGEGTWPDRIVVDGQEQTGAWCLPLELSRGGLHKVEVSFGETAPRGPVIMEASGLGLVEANTSDGGRVAHALLRGPGRAWVRYHSPTKPTTICNGQPVPDNWQSVERTGRVEVLAPDDEPVELQVIS